MNKQYTCERNTPFKYNRGSVGNANKLRMLPAYLRYPIPKFIYDAIEIKIMPIYEMKDTTTGYGAAAPRVSLEECSYAKTSPC